MHAYAYCVLTTSTRITSTQYAYSAYWEVVCGTIAFVAECALAASKN